MDLKWKSVAIEGFEHYIISRCGKLFNIRTKKYVKGWKNSGGYRRVWLINGKKRIKFYLHRLVAITHICLPEEELEVHHLNGVRDDNRVENLQWVTREENMAHVHGTSTQEEDIPF